MYLCRLSTFFEKFYKLTLCYEVLIILFLISLLPRVMSPQGENLRRGSARPHLPKALGSPSVWCLDIETVGLEILRI